MTLTYVSPLFQKALDESSLDAETKRRIIDSVVATGSCQNIEGLPEAIKNVFVVSSDITPEEHILMQTSIQAFVDNSISKTCNFPEGASKDDVSKVYQNGLGAWG